MRIFILSICALVVLSCAKEEETKVLVDPEFEPFVTSFIEEAAKRGTTIDFESTGLSITFGEVPANANGVCTGLREGISSTHEITIDRNRWKGDNEFDKERLIFHELGHCHLLRGHISDTLANGEWKSIMRGVPPEGYGYRSFNMTGIRRDFYIDELFNTNINIPEWASITADYKAVTDAQKEELIKVENRVDFFRSTDLSGDFEIELQFDLSDDFLRNQLGFSWGGFGEENSMAVSFSALNLFIVNRLEGYGVIRAFENFDGLRLGERTKMSVQKIDDKYYYFINERFIYWSEAEPLTSNSVQINQNASFQYAVPLFTVKRLNL